MYNPILMLGLDSYSKQLSNKRRLASAIPFFTSRTCPFRSMFMASYPCNVRHAVSKEKKPIPGLTSRLMRAMVLFDKIIEVLALPELTRSGKIPCCLHFAFRLLDRLRFYRP
jgi:hypothetical protein